MAKSMPKKKSPPDTESERTKLLRRHRRIVGLSITDLAKEIGVSVPSVSGWERGAREPSAKMIPKYAAALHITPAELLDILDKK